jgi:CheY-like chemotaxis protein
MSQTILIVEDEPASLRVLSYYLHQEGYYVLQARNGFEAIELIDQFRVDVVLSDLKMPGMDGVALARHIISKLPHTPIMVMTAYAADDVNALLELRVPYLGKPLILEKLKSEIQTLLSCGTTS